MIVLITESQKKELISNLKNDTDSLIGKKVKAYYDITRHMFSVTFGGIVVLKADYVRLENVRFLVSESGKSRVRSEKQKNVHAYVSGTLVDYCKNPCEDLPKPKNNVVITYNPYRDEFFNIKSTGEIIRRADEVEMINSKDKIFLVK
jgi:hypothetical protein